MAHDEPIWLVPAPTDPPREATARIEELETSLRASWSDEMLAVYADQLQLIGDPRGELIALDLSEPSTASERRRGELLREWFTGDRVEVWWSDQDKTWFAGSRVGNTWLMLERGLIEAVHVGDAQSRAAVLRAFLATPKSDLLHRVSISGSSTTLRLVLAALTGRQRPWLRALSIKRLPDDDRQPLIDGDALVATLPNLASLELEGRRLIDRLDHANVGELVLTGYNAIDLQTASGWPNVTSLDYAASASGDWTMDSLLLSLIRRDRFPGLRQLDLSRQEPGGIAFPQLRTLDVAEQLTNLVLPALRTPYDMTCVQDAIDRMPALRELVVERSYMCFGQLAEQLRHPTARIRIPAAYPWPPRAQVQIVRVENYELSATILIEALEDAYDDLTPEVQAFWTRFWIRASRIDDTELVETTDLQAALDALTLDDPAWVTVRDELPALSRYGTITVSVR